MLLSRDHGDRFGTASFYAVAMLTRTRRTPNTGWAWRLSLGLGALGRPVQVVVGDWEARSSPTISRIQAGRGWRAASHRLARHSR